MQKIAQRRAYRKQHSPCIRMHSFKGAELLRSEYRPAAVLAPSASADASHNVTKPAHARGMLLRSPVACICMCSSCKSTGMWAFWLWRGQSLDVLRPRQGGSLPAVPGLPSTTMPQTVRGSCKKAFEYEPSPQEHSGLNLM